MIGSVEAIGRYDAYVAPVRSVAEAKKAHIPQSEIKKMEQTGQIECETCKNRKYQDGSDEMVSFKAPGHISPQASVATVMAHEQQHVSNAYSKAGENNGKVVSASVTLHTSICPECGRSYVSGGVTNTAIKYINDSYGASKKNYDAAKGAVGGNIDLAG